MAISLEKRINDVIKNTEWLFFQNIDLIGKYTVKISRLKNGENAQYFQKEIERYNNIITGLKAENEEYIREIEDFKKLLKVS